MKPTHKTIITILFENGSRKKEKTVFLKLKNSYEAQDTFVAFDAMERKKYKQNLGMEPGNMFFRFDSLLANKGAWMWHDTIKITKKYKTCNFSDFTEEIF